MNLEGKRILVTGGTGSLGKVLIKRLLSNEMGRPKQIVVFSRDEAKQHEMRMEYQNKRKATEDIIYRNYQELLTFRIGDVRDFHSVATALRDIDVVFNAAALKQVPTCEYFPYEAVMTNISAPENIVSAIRELELPVETVVGISTDKACKPVNVMGMTKAIQERVFIHGNLDCPSTRFICVRYGNVLASRGSVIPFFHEQIKAGGPVTLTSADMTRFLLSLREAVDTIFAAVKGAKAGETYIPRVRSALVKDIADILIEDRKIATTITGVRPGEKIHEILVSEEEANRTVARGEYLAIGSILPEIGHEEKGQSYYCKEYSSAENLMSRAELEKVLRSNKLMVGDDEGEEELLR